jgi:hypothetical protein
MYQQSTQQRGKGKHQGSISEYGCENRYRRDCISYSPQCPGNPDCVWNNVLNGSINENKCFSLIIAVIISGPFFLPEIREYNHIDM